MLILSLLICLSLVNRLHAVNFMRACMLARRKGGAGFPNREGKRGSCVPSVVARRQWNFYIRNSALLGRRVPDSFSNVVRVSFHAALV